MKSDETVRGKDVRHRWWGRSDSWSSLESPGWITDGGAGDFVDSAAVRNGSFLRVFHGCVGFFLLGWAGLLSHSRGSRHPPTRMGQPADSPRHEVVVVCLGSMWHVSSPHSPQSFRLWRPTCSCNGPPLCSASVTSGLCSSVPRRLPSTHHRLDPTLETHRYPTLSSVFFLSISSSLVGWDRPDRPSSATSVPLRPLSSIPPLPFGGPKDGARRGPQGGLAVAVLPDTRERVGGTAVCDGVRVCGTFGASGRTKSSALRVHDRRAVVSEVWKATR